jgi:hypothetical protein
MSSILAYIVNRMKEPSTYAGLAALLGVVGLKVAPDQLNAIITVLTGIAGAIAVFVPDLNKPSA